MKPDIVYLILSLEDPVEMAPSNREDLEPQRVARMARKTMMSSTTAHSQQLLVGRLVMNTDITSGWAY